MLTNIYFWSCLFLIEILALYFCSKVLINTLGQIFYRLTKSREETVSLLALFFLPGTIVHELSHAIVAGVLLVPVGNIEFMPEIMDNGRVKLGSAQISQTDIFRRALIGVAPILVGLALIITPAILSINSLSSSASTSILVIILICYMVFEISNTMFSSPKDLEGVTEVLIIVLGLFLSFYFLKISLPLKLLQTFLADNFQLLQKICLILLIPILLDSGIYLLFKSLLSFKR